MLISVRGGTECYRQSDGQRERERERESSSEKADVVLLPLEPAVDCTTVSSRALAGSGCGAMPASQSASLAISFSSDLRTGEKQV